VPPSNIPKSNKDEENQAYQEKESNEYDRTPKPRFSFRSKLNPKDAEI